MAIHTRAGRSSRTSASGESACERDTLWRMSGGSAEIDERLCVMLARTDERGFIVGDCLTFPGRFSISGFRRTGGSRCVLWSEVKDASSEGEGHWIAGFLHWSVLAAPGGCERNRKRARGEQAVGLSCSLASGATTGTLEVTCEASELSGRQSPRHRGVRLLGLLWREKATELRDCLAGLRRPSDTTATVPARIRRPWGA